MPGWRSIDLTADGLRAYFACGAGTTGTAPILSAKRPNRTSPFVVEGQVAELECCPSVDPTERFALSAVDFEMTAAPVVADFTPSSRQPASVDSV